MNETETSKPLPTDVDGITNERDRKGRFAKGNRASKGNPLAGRVNKLRSVLLSAITEKDLRQVVKTLIAEAKGGDVPAIRELLSRLFGAPTQRVENEQVGGPIEISVVQDENWYGNANLISAETAIQSDSTLVVAGAVQNFSQRQAVGKNGDGLDGGR